MVGLRIERGRAVNSLDRTDDGSPTIVSVCSCESRQTSEYLELEAFLCASHVDVDDHERLASHCLQHAVAEDKLRAMIDVFRPLSEAFSVYLTK